MKKTLLLLTLLAVMLSLSAQDKVTVKFTAKDQNGKYCSFTEVEVTNVTRNWTSTLHYPDTVLNLTPTGVGEYGATACRLGNAFPNPFTGETSVPLELSEAAEVLLRVVRIDGTEMASRALRIDAGMHHVEVRLASPGLSFLIVTTPKSNQVTKLVSECGSGRNAIEVKALASRDAKSGSYDATGDFVLGDMMKYVGKTTFESAPVTSAEVTQTQSADATVVLEFPVSIPSITIPVVSTADVTDITETIATAGGELIDNGGASITECGVCWSTSADPTTFDNHLLVSVFGLSAFTVNITDLIPNTTYHVRAYATNSVGTAYGEDKTFITLDPGNYAGHDYVDLGLPSGTLWATCNVGANSPEERGDRFAWGETQPKDYYSWDNYQYGGFNQLTKYCNLTDCGLNGYTDELTVLQAEDDAATANWGNGWRTPTAEECVELCQHTTFTWTTMNGIDGALFTASNGNSLFLPSTGDLDGEGVGDGGCYWTSTLDTGRPVGAWGIGFWHQGLVGVYPVNGGDGGRKGRYCGVAIRPIRYLNEPGNGDGDGGYFNLDVKVTTHEPTHITTTTVECIAEVDEINLIPQGHYNGNLWLELGLCWSTHDTPTINDDHVFTGIYGATPFTFTLTGLEPNTEYHVRAYASLGSQFYYYGEDKSFTTIDPGSHADHDYVDLGLPSGTLWATCNVGADTPEGYGDYFAWGETQPKSAYTWETYKWCNGDRDQLTKYCMDSNHGYNGFADYLPVLESTDDAATVNWGEDWCMPTMTQWWELYKNTTFIWTTQNGTNGLLFTGSNGNSIFFPAAGAYRYNNELYYPESEGFYWGKSLVIIEETQIIPGVDEKNLGGLAVCFREFIEEMTLYGDGGCDRSWGMPVRAVRAVSDGSGNGYVDLGLLSGALWATCNVGATAPEEFGDYFAWGETEPKDRYDWSNYKWCKGGFNQLTKYCINASSGYNGFTDNLFILESCDDAAFVNMGNEWHTPSAEEVDELYRWTWLIWKTRNGINGWQCIGTNGNSIFIPVAGYYEGNEHVLDYGIGYHEIGSCCYYWVNRLYSDQDALDFSDWRYRFHMNRSYGLPVRPVRSAK